MIARNPQTLTQTVPLDAVGGNHFGRYKKQSVEETYNMIVSSGNLVTYAGYKKQREIQKSGEARGMYKSDVYNHVFVVIDNNVYAISVDLGIALVGQLDTSTGDVFIAENNNKEVAFVDGLDMHVFNYGSGADFTKVTLDFRPVSLDFDDGYLVAAAGGTNNWRLSEPNKATSWPPAAANVGAIESKPNLAVFAVSFDSQLFVMGTKVVEVWRDVGNTLFPYQKDRTITIDYGCLSPASIATGIASSNLKGVPAGTGVLVWLASNEESGPTIVMSTGGQPIVISNEGLNFRLDKLTKPENCSAFLFEEDGHLFYQITWPADNLTYTYDFETGEFFSLSDNCLNYHIAKKVVFFRNTHYFVSFSDANFYELSTAYTSLDGVEMPRVRITKPFRLASSKRFSVNNITLTIEQGNADTIQRVDLSVSRDGGESFDTVEGKVLNSLGNRPNKLRFWKIGAANDMVFQFRYWSLDRFVVLGAEITYTEGL